MKFTDENKEEKFRRIASSRTQKILDNIRLLGNCSNKSAYDYNEEQVNKMFQAIDREIKRVRELFKGSKTKDNRFNF